jgi:hypothetical protein
MELFVTKRANQHLETPMLMEIFLSKTDLILTGRQCAQCHFLTKMFVFPEMHVFLQLS